VNFHETVLLAPGLHSTFVSSVELPPYLRYYSVSFCLPPPPQGGYFRAFVDHFVAVGEERDSLCQLFQLMFGPTVQLTSPSPRGYKKLLSR
jgi:hypothetical protein